MKLLRTGSFVQRPYERMKSINMASPPAVSDSGLRWLVELKTIQKAGRPLPIFFLFFPIFPKYSYLVLLHDDKCYCRQNFRTLQGQRFYTNSLKIMAHLDIGLTHLKHREDICTHLYLDL